MARVRLTTEISRDELARIGLEEVRVWPGCESIVSIGVLQSGSERFALRIAEYGAAPSLPIGPFGRSSAKNSVAII